MSYLPCEIVETHNKPNAAVIWLHGLGASGHDFVPMVPELSLTDEDKIRFVFPHAPQMPVTVNGGMLMPAWYDIFELSLERKIDYTHIEQSAKAVHALIRRENERGIPSERIVVAGFSQGGAVAYHAAIEHEETLAGLFTLSTYYATHDKVKASVANKQLPIHVFHGIHDNVVPEMAGRMAIERLQSAGYQPTYKTYPVDHSLHHQEIKDISQRLRDCLPPVR